MAPEHQREPAVPASRRERSKAQNLAKIFDAAQALFAAHGYAAVTTQQVAERADVAAGTVFRYASTKAELLLMVSNRHFAGQVRAGTERAAGTAGFDAGLRALLEPVLAGVALHGKSTAAYQREMLFGDDTERYRSEALWTLARLVAEISRMLRGRLANHPDPAACRAAARAIAAVIFVEIANGTRDPQLVPGTFDRCAEQVGLIVQALSARRAAASVHP